MSLSPRKKYEAEDTPLLSQPHKISFVSGKGGVGKTSLAVNFAWICGHFAKTLLIDLDFQNQGATGLLSSFITPDCGSALDAILHPAILQECHLVNLDSNLYFLPAVPLQAPPKHSELFKVCQQPDFVLKLENLLNRIHQAYEFEIVVLDCHGGLDLVSLAAHQVSDHTLVITEADRVTFNGTLELLDFYQAAQMANKTAALAVAQGGGISTAVPVQLQYPKPVELVVNRIPPKYRWDDLNRVYQKAIAGYGTELNISSEILSYIPSEDFVMESFGEIPFLIKVAPNSIMSKKLHLLIYKLFSSKFKSRFDRYKPLAQLDNERRRRRLERTLESAESRNIKAIIVAFAFGSNGYLLLCLAGLAYTIAKNAGVTLEVLDSVFGYCLLLYFFALSVSFLKAVLGLSRYYKDKYLIQRNLLKTANTPSLWQKISIVKIFLLRSATSLMPYVVGATIVGVMMFLIDAIL